MYAFPPLLFVFTHSFPAALCFYWLTTNIFSVGQVLIGEIFVNYALPIMLSLGQSSLLRMDRVRKLPFINIPEIKVNPLLHCTRIVQNITLDFRHQKKCQKAKDQRRAFFRELGWLNLMYSPTNYNFGCHQGDRGQLQHHEQDADAGEVWAGLRREAVQGGRHQEDQDIQVRPHQACRDQVQGWQEG